MNITDTYQHQGLRKRLAEELASKGISDPAVLAAMRKVPRHLFFDPIFVEQAYQNKAFPIGEGQTISHPFTVAYQSELLNLKKGDKVLEIGTGSGYQTCILAELGATIYTIERQQKLFEKAKVLVAALNYKARFFCGDGSKGIPAFAPFDKIIVTAGAPVIPETLVEQLKIGGLLIIPVGDEKSQKMVTVLKTKEKEFEQFELDTFKFVPLIGEKAWK